MIDVEPLIISGLERLVPMPNGDRADWQDVRQRAGIESDRRRRTALALAGFAAAVLVAVATPVGGAIAKGIGDFSAWLTGHPGKKAPASEQRAFEAANGHSWASFPSGTQLRELIRTTIGGRLYILSGFRSGNSVCLQLSGMTRRTKTGPACAPVSTLAHISAPIVVVTADGGFVDQYSHSSAMFSVGIAADGVKHVDVRAVDGTHRALMGGNSYLWIESEPNTGNRVTGISATSADGRTTTMSFPSRVLPPFLEGTGKPGGPTRIQATIRHPRIGWVVRHERRGLTPEQAKLTPEQRRSIGSVFTDVRLFKPDPLSNLVVGLTYDGCIVVVGGGGGCGAPAGTFSRGPFNFMTFGGRSSDQFLGVAGAAADGIKQIKIYLADGERQSAPLKDNMFAALVPARFPIKVVAYDAARRVVGIQTFPPSSFAAHLSVPSAARRNLHDVLQVTGPNGTTATVSVGRVVNRQRCWRIRYSTGQPESGCELTFYTGPKINVNLVQPAGRDLFIVGSADSRVTARVELHFADGDVITTNLASDHYVFAIPKAHMSRQRQFAYVLAVDRHGHRVQRQGIAFRSSR
jgi:hypothetical protein